MLLKLLFYYVCVCVFNKSNRVYLVYKSVIMEREREREESEREVLSQVGGGASFKKKR